MDNEMIIEVEKEKAQLLKMIEKRREYLARCPNDQLVMLELDRDLRELNALDREIRYYQ